MTVVALNSGFVFHGMLAVWVWGNDDVSSAVVQPAKLKQIHRFASNEICRICCHRNT